MKRLIALLALVSVTVSQGLGFAQPKVSVYTRIARATIAADALFNEPRPTSIKEAIHPQMSQQYKYATVLNLFASVDMPEESKPFIARQAWQDLELVPSLLSAVDRTKTIFGKAELARILAGEQQINDIQELVRRQQVVRTLVANPSLFNALQKMLNKFKDAEESFLIFFLKESAARKQILKNFYFNGAYKEIVESVPGMGELCNEGDKSPELLVSTEMWSHLGTAIDLIALASTVKGLYTYGEGMVATARGTLNGQNNGTALESTDSNPSTMREKIGFGAAAVGASWLVLKGLKSIITAYEKIEKFNKTVNALIDLPQRPLRIINPIRFKYEIVPLVQQDLMNLAQACKGMRAMSNFLSQKTNVKALMPECNALFDMFEKPETNSHEVNDLLELLRTSTFKGKPSVFSHYGRIFAANRLMELSKEHWVSVFKAIGQLDVYMSIATLVKEFESKRVHYSFANFVQSDKPVLVLKDFWNPLINPDVVVSNNASLGNGGPRSMIVTGPNSGGKSVVLKSIAHAALLAQTLGVAPAAHITITPFSTINTLINVSDAIPAGLSRFRAEVAQAQALVAKLKGQKPQEFNLVVCDELFSSTSEDQAEELVAEYAKIFAQPNNICVQATHHPRLMVKLEQEVKDGSANIFENYKVDIDELPSGQLKRNYKLERGVSSQKFARKILQEFGAIPGRAG